MNKKITAERLREALDNKGMRAQELANKTGIDKSSISQQLSGRHSPSEESAKKEASVLGVNYLWLLGHDVTMLEPKAYYEDAISKLQGEISYYDELQKYAKLLNKNGIDQVTSYIKYIASQEEYKK